MILSHFILFVLLVNCGSCFLIGGCIGPRKVFEKYLTEVQRKELTLLIEDRFDGRNKDQVLQEVYAYVQRKITVDQWRDIEPQIRAYQKKNISCSPYSQLLPPKYFRPLMKAVRRAADTGADRSKIKYLVEDYLDRILFTKEFVKEFRKQPPLGEAKVKPIKSLKTEYTNHYNSEVIKVTSPPKPVFPILEVWKVFPQTSKNDFYYKIG